MDLSSDPRLGAFLASQAPIFAKQNLSEDRRWTTYLISYISIGVALLFLVLRLWARFRRSFGYGLDDWIIILAFCFLGGNLGCVIKCELISGKSNLTLLTDRNSGSKWYWIALWRLDPASSNGNRQGKFSNIFSFGTKDDRINRY